MSEIDSTRAEQIARWYLIAATVRNHAGCAAYFFREIADVIEADPAALDRHGYAARTWRSILADAVYNARGGRRTVKQWQRFGDVSALVSLCRKLAIKDRKGTDTEARKALGIHKKGRAILAASRDRGAHAAALAARLVREGVSDPEACERAAAEYRCEEATVSKALVRLAVSGRPIPARLANKKRRDPSRHRALQWLATMLPD
jgi:hypothetical protein